MKYITLFFGLLFFSVLSADGHLKSEKDVLVALQKYFEARNSEDYKTVVALESKSGTYGTNSDGSFHKPKQITMNKSPKPNPEMNKPTIHSAF